MSFLRRPFQLGSLTLPNNIFYAPLAGCSNFPYRQLSNRYRPGLFFCEMVKMDALIRYDSTTLHLLDYEANMHPIGAQLCGSRPEIAGKAAKIVEELGFDSVDFNCGCPVDKVTKDGSGSGMLKTPERIGEIIANIVAAVKIPVTVKIRTGWDEEHIVATEITQIAERAGASAITIHGRTREQAYRGKANWDHIKACKSVAKTIQVVGNGDLLEACDARLLFEQTSCDAVLVARGTMGQPWIVEQIIADLSGESSSITPCEEYCRERLLEHFDLLCDYLPQRKALVEVRKMGCWYLKGSNGTKELRALISGAKDRDELITALSKSCS